MYIIKYVYKSITYEKNDSRPPGADLGVFQYEPVQYGYDARDRWTDFGFSMYSKSSSPLELIMLSTHKYTGNLSCDMISSLNI